MKTSAIKYPDLLKLAELCRTRPGSDWIDLMRFAAMLTEGKYTTTIKASAPDNLTEAIAQARKNGTEKVKTLEEMAIIFGVTRKTLNNWRRLYKIHFWKIGRFYDISPIIEQLQQLTREQKH